MREGIPVSFCRHCRKSIIFGQVILGEWAHTSGSRYCQDNNGFTRTPLSVAEPVLETEVL